MHLSEIHEPADIKRCSCAQLGELAGEIRRCIIRTVARRGGHLASNLGVVELTLALHRVFDTPADKIIFDVGHQCYTHKLLTGRYAAFDSLRTTGGLSGFPKRAESEHDCFETGHASTAISAALGFARARDLRGGTNHVVAVVGDGALTGGMCYEALNDAGSSGTRLIVVLNDNEMSISRSVGALSNYLTHLRVSKGWLGIKKAITRALLALPGVGKPLHHLFQRAKNSIRNIFVRDTLFRSLGFQYLGPVDGHDVRGLEHVLRRARQIDKPVLIHVVTKKGFGYERAEEKPDAFHGIAPFYMDSGELRKQGAPGFGALAAQKVAALAREDARVVTVSAAMTASTGLSAFEREFPERLFDVGIAEEHAVTMAAGMAAGGLRPFVFIYDTFLQRAYDQIAHDVCMQNLPVVFLLDRAGLVGEDGATHHGVFDLSYLRHLPNMQVFSPYDARELAQMLDYALKAGGPVAIRYPRRAPAGVGDGEPFAPGRWRTLLPGTDGALLAVGAMVDTALEAARTLRAVLSLRVVNASSVKPLDGALLRELAREGVPCFTLEEHALAGGFGGAVCEYCAAQGLPAPRLTLALPDRFIGHGAREELLREVRLDANSVCARIVNALLQNGAEIAGNVEGRA